MTGLPCGLCEPLCIVGLEAAPEAPCVCVQQDRWGPSPVVAEVTIPLIAWVRDACGRTCQGQSKVIVYCHMPTSCACAQGSFMAAARVRLLDPGCPSCEPVFTVNIHVQVEVHLVRMEPCGCRPGCDDFRPQPFHHMPMYPQPFYLQGQ